MDTVQPPGEDVGKVIKFLDGVFVYSNEEDIAIILLFHFSKIYSMFF